MTPTKMQQSHIDFVKVELKSTMDKFANDDLTEVYDEVLTVFLQEAESLKVDYLKQVKARNALQFAKAAHALKGTFAALGQTTLKIRMEQEELSARDLSLNWESIEAGLETFESCFAQLIQSIESLKSGR